MSLFRDMVQTAGPDTEAVSKPLPAVQPSEALAGADPNPKQGKGKGKGKSKDKDEIKKRPPGPQHIVMRIIFDKANAMHFPENMEMSEKMKKGWQLYKQWKNAEPGTDEAAKIADYEALLRASWVEKMGTMRRGRCSARLDVFLRLACARSWTLRLRGVSEVSGRDKCSTLYWLQNY